MIEWLGWLCMAVAGLQVVGVVWCVCELRRKSVPELWGIDWLDILFRLERVFGIVFRPSDFDAWSPDDRLRISAGQLWELVQRKLEACRQSIPDDGWDTITLVLAESLNIHRNTITYDRQLSKDFGMERRI